MTEKKEKCYAKQPVKQPKGQNYGLPLATKGLPEKSGCLCCFKKKRVLQPINTFYTNNLYSTTFRLYNILKLIIGYFVGYCWVQLSQCVSKLVS